MSRGTATSISDSGSLDDELEDDIDLGVLESASLGSVKKDAPKAGGVRSSNTANIVHKKKPPTLSVTPHEFDPQALQTYIYPTNLQVRDYQYNIVYRSFFHNTLVALPTGLGKTFIASTVILNFNRWFPTLKIIFMAPTKPLVAQQIKACCGITGISASKVAILLDKTRRNRAEIWAEKQVFFTTPQVVENDLAAGIVDPKSIVLLVIDEAHRSKGNYAYNNVAKFISRFNTNYRILAMTATPSSTVEGVQEIIDNLLVSKVEVRTEQSIDIFRYLKRKTVERVSVETSDEVAHAMNLLGEAVLPILQLANQKQVYEVRDFRHINAFTAMDAQRRLMANKNIPEGLKWANNSILQLLAMIGQCIKRLSIYGVRAFYSYFLEKHLEFTTKFNNKKSKNSMAAKLHFHPSIKKLVSFCEAQVLKPAFLGHRKLEIVILELHLFYEKTLNPDSRVIIFTEFRESALDIVRAIEANQAGAVPLKPHIFIGQAKERDKFDEEAFLKKGKEKKTRDTSKTSSEQAQVTGMNQKLQKEIIRQFKTGVYNILVATSIGEEGLDIGEVDLIICYDSTSSPIKNIQRMGRTGRNRDGKVLVLFSGNEEAKFDKAMGGYEYIQQHIMSGNMVELHNQVRVIPKEFSPKVVETLIEIPDENVELKNEEDEDEIIKIATRYMANPKSKGLQAKKKAQKPAKIEKRFFMPDDVATGFQLANSVLKGTEIVSKEIEPRAPDFLDSLLDSDVDDFADLQDNPIFSTQEVLPVQPADKSQTTYTSQAAAIGKTAKKQPEILNFVSRSSTASLGTRKRPMGPGNQILKKVALEDKDEEYKSSSTKGSEIYSAPSPKIEFPENRSASSDDFSDDDEILALARRTQSFDKKHTGKHLDQVHHQQKLQISTKPKAEFEIQNGAEEKSVNITKKIDPDPLHKVGESDGLLSKDEVTELYMSYYSPVDSRDMANCYVPMDIAQEAEIKHTTKTANLLAFHETLRTQKGGHLKPQAVLQHKLEAKLEDIIVPDQ